jgi:hypothetical protein
MNGDIPCPINPLTTHGDYVDRNMERIVATIPIDISRTIGIVENVFIEADFSLEEIEIYTELFKEFHNIFSWYYEEIPGIDPRIVDHEITTYHDVKPV